MFQNARRLLFTVSAPDEGGGAGTTNPTNPTQPPPTPPTDTTKPEENNPAWLPGRLEQARRAAITDLLKTLGVETPDAAKTLIEGARKSEEEKLTELQKAQKQLEAAQKKAADAEAEKAKVEEERQNERIDAAITAAAKGATNPEDVVLHIRTRHADALAATVKDGKADATALGKLIETVKKERPIWFGTGSNPGSPSNNGGRAVQPGDKERVAAQAEYNNRLRKRF